MKIIQSKDAALLAEMNRELQELHYNMYPEKYKPFNLESFKGYYTDLLNHKQIACFVCYSKDLPIGHFVIEEKLHPDNPFSKEFKFIYIMQIFVKNVFRKKGIGSEIMEKIKAIAKGRGINKILLDVKDKNALAKDFFTNQGFIPFNSSMDFSLE